MQETWVPFLGGEDPLEEERATHSSILAWKIQWTEEPGGFSIESQKKKKNKKKNMFKIDACMSSDNGMLSQFFCIRHGQYLKNKKIFLYLLFQWDYWRRQRHPTPVLLPGKSHGRRSLVGCSPWGR